MPATELLSAVCTVYGISGEEISGGSRLASEARSMAALMALETDGCTIAEIAQATGRDPSSLSSAAKRIEARARKEVQVRQRREMVAGLIAQLHA